MTAISGTARAAATLPVNEVFGPVWQGEGPHLGRVCHFIRLGRCNLHCPDCDTAHTWDTTRFDVDRTCPPATAQDIVSRLSGPVRLVILSGGEPLMHQRRLAFTELLGLLAEFHPDAPVHVETNGTIPPSVEAAAKIAYFTVSPKLGAMGSADPARRRIRAGALAAFCDLAHAGRACFKIVCAGPEDVQEAARFAAAYRIDAAHVWIMPRTGGDVDWPSRGVELAQRHAALAPAVTAAGFNLTTRLHLLADSR